MLPLGITHDCLCWFFRCCCTMKNRPLYACCIMIKYNVRERQICLVPKIAVCVLNCYNCVSILKMTALVSIWVEIVDITGSIELRLTGRDFQLVSQNETKT